jgi:hypothetical protein
MNKSTREEEYQERSKRSRVIPGTREEVITGSTGLGGPGDEKEEQMNKLNRKKKLRGRERVGEE